MRSDLESNQAFDQLLKSGRFSHSRKTLAADVTITKNGSLVNFFSPGGADRIVTLPPFEDGLFYLVSNIGASNTLTVKDSAGATVTALLPSDTALVLASDLEWVALRGWAALGVFTNTINGLVPAPNSITPGSLFLRDDGQWAQVQVVGIVDAFKFMTDGTNTAIGSGPDTFRFRSSTNKIGITVTNGEAVFGDNVNLTVVEANVDHDALLNFFSNEHVDHTGVVLTAGVGISGGGDISASRTFNLDLNDLTSDTPVLADTFGFYDVSGGDTNKATFTVLNGILDHNALLNYVANRHIDHTAVSFTASTGLSGGGDISASRSFSIDFNSLVADSIAVGDFIVFYDISGGDHNKITFANLTAATDHNSLLNYVANQHIDHTAVTMTAGTGLTGGGTIAATRTFNVATDGITNTLLANMATMTIKSNITGGSADPADNTMTAILDAVFGATRGMILTRGAANWQALALGTSGFALKSNGTDAIWAAGGTGDLVSTNNLSDVANAGTSRTNLAAFGKVIEQVFTASGTYTPTAGMLYCIIECVGGGGGGGGVAGSATNNFVSGGGGAGSYARLVATAATIGASKAVTIGAGGAGGTSGANNGSAGGDTSVGSLCIGKGGSGGTHAAAGSSNPRGGAGGVAGTGGFTPVGNAGNAGVWSNDTGVVVGAGQGAGSFFGGAPQVTSVTGGAANAGVAASDYGAGGSGANAFAAAANAAGGNGRAGVVIVREFFAN